MERFIRQAAPGGLFLEFGVYRGRSLRAIAAAVAAAPAEIVYGFDSFEGLPEAWGDAPKGTFRCEPPTDLPVNVVLVVGLFADTLGPFLAQHPGRWVSFVHIDCDLYSSTKFVLESLRDRLDGAVVVFDEIGPNPLCAEHEGRAFDEFLTNSDYAAEFLGQHHSQAAAYKLTRARA